STSCARGRPTPSSSASRCSRAPSTARARRSAGPRRGFTPPASSAQASSPSRPTPWSAAENPEHGGRRSAKRVDAPLELGSIERAGARVGGELLEGRFPRLGFGGDLVLLRGEG